MLVELALFWFWSFVVLGLRVVDSYRFDSVYNLLHILLDDW